MAARSRRRIRPEGGAPVEFDIADRGAAGAGRRRIEWAERSMPVLGQVRARFAAERPLAGARIAACLHVTAETAVLVRALTAGGAAVALCASNPLSTQDDTAAALVEDGISVFARSGVDAAAYELHLDRALDSCPHLLLDDGCDLTEAVHLRRSDARDEVRAATEDTTTGIVRLRAMSREGSLRFPVVNLNDTAIRRLFDARFGTGQSTLDALLRATNLLVAGRTFVIAGFGAAGRGIAERARGLGGEVIVTEVDPLRALDARMHGYRVMPMADAAPLGDVFITATGTRDVIRPEHLRMLKDGAVLANAGHFDVEVDVTGLTEMAVEKRPSVRPATDEYRLDDGRRVLLLAEGRVVNLAAAEGHPATVMDLAFATQALVVESLCAGDFALQPGVHAVPDGVDEQVAALELAAAGIRIDALTDAQRYYLRSFG